MPSALETLVKILKLEREQGYKNTAVIGGLAAFSENWAPDAHNQARIPEHHEMVDELVGLLRRYEQDDSRIERHNQVSYMLDRIMGRVTPSSPAKEKEQRESVEPRASEPPPKPKQPPPVVEQQPEPPTQDDSVQEDDDDLEDETENEAPTAEQERGESSSREWSSKSGKRASSRRGKRDSSSVASVSLDIKPQPRLARPPRKRRLVLTLEEAAKINEQLDEPVRTVKGVGPRTAHLLENLGIETARDLLYFLPRRYDDYTRLTYISKLRPNMTATVIGTVQSANVRMGKNNRKDFAIVLDDGSATMPVIFFGQHFLVRQIKRGQQIVVSGSTSIYGHQIQMTNPEWEFLDTDNLHTTGIVPVYPLTQGLGARTMRRLIRTVVNTWAERVPDYVPESTLERAELGSLGWTIQNLHFPESFDHLNHARRRFIFDQLLLLQLAILGNRRDWQSVPGQAIPVSDDFLESFTGSVFPYTLTGAQNRAIHDIRRDVASATPMNRLLQGDVGSGKTAVALVTIALALANGKQAALMAPTGILAEQHYRNLSEMLERMPGDRKPVVGLLTSSLTSTEREAIYNGLADGSIDVIIGTHALIQAGVEFHDLAIAIIDEQHRFGVEQRGSLRSKGTNPHLLVMTATPIPRTLALTIYADLDLSILDEKPPGREPVQTRIVSPVERERIYSFAESQLDKGQQVFVVYPLVEASETIEAEAATEAYERLKKVFFRYKVGLLHGRMKPAEKDEIMAAFSNHQFDVLVTTSVAEVGVDIPNASLMIIEGANRFGLSQLHQFRGRVGRGEHTSYCLLVSDSNTPESHERLQAMESTTDGFKLAEIDWKMRGAGDLVGTRQSGHHKLQLLEEMTPQLVELAQRESRTIYAEDPDLSKPEHALLAQQVTILHNPDSDVS
jgi:ATP-dependent DNA helicase RecG